MQRTDWVIVIGIVILWVISFLRPDNSPLPSAIAESYQIEEPCSGCEEYWKMQEKAIAQDKWCDGTEINWTWNGA